MTTIGVLALQGCVQAHRAHIEALGGSFVSVRNKADLESKKLSALIVPGGESSTMLKSIDILGLEDALIKASKSIPFLGVCAGAIIMAQKVRSPEQHSLGLVDVEIERNAYGRQLDSFEVPHPTQSQESLTFIRAPIVREYSKDCEVIVEHEGQAVLLKQGRHLIATFHPELSTKTPSFVHRLLFDEATAAAGTKLSSGVGNA